MKLLWDQIGERLYETGVSKGVLFPCKDDGSYDTGVAWNGLTNVSERPSGAEPTALYADNIKYLNIMSKEEFAATIEAYTYPDKFAECDGSAALGDGFYIGQQTRRPFGFSYTSNVGNDTLGNDYGEKIHLVYGCLASPSEKGNATINDSPEASTMSWEVNTTPVDVPNHKQTAHIYIDTTKYDADDVNVAWLRNTLYGTDATTGENATPGTEPTLPTIAQLIEHFGTTAPDPDEEDLNPVG